MISDTHHLAKKLLRDGNLSECIARCKKLLQQNPHDVPALHILGLAISETGNNEIGAHYLWKASSLLPNDQKLRSDHHAVLGRLINHHHDLAERKLRNNRHADLDETNIVLILSTGRSGTQWLAENLARYYDDRFIVTHEPLYVFYRPKYLLGSNPEAAGASAALDLHFQRIDRHLHRANYVECGWPAFAAVP